MRKKLIGGLAVAAALCMAAPAWANGGHGHRHGHGHAYGHAKHIQKHHVRQHYVAREVYRPVPVYRRAFYPAYPVFPAAAPGIHVILPNVYIPFH